MVGGNVGILLEIVLFTHNEQIHYTVPDDESTSLVDALTPPPPLQRRSCTGALPTGFDPSPPLFEGIFEMFKRDTTINKTEPMITSWKKSTALGKLVWRTQPGTYPPENPMSPMLSSHVHSSPIEHSPYFHPHTCKA